MQKKNLIVSALTLVLFSAIGFAQESDDVEPIKTERIRPYRIGVKIGFPNLVGGNVEYVTPLLGNRLSVSADYSLFKSGWIINKFEEEDQDAESIDMKYSYLEFGANYYFFKPGRGLYAGLGYGTIKVHGFVDDIEGEDGSNAGKTGTTDIDFNHGSLNITLGAKLGNLFYFRPEIGYSFNSLPDTYDIDVVFDDGSHEVQNIELKQDTVGFLFSGLKFNIGFGFSF